MCYDSGVVKQTAYLIMATATTTAPATTTTTVGVIPAPTTPSRLTGADLLAKVAEMGDDVTRFDLCQACGYINTVTAEDGTTKTSALYTAFYEALLEAKGMSMPKATRSGTGGAGGPKPSYTARVNSTGNLIVLGCYTKEANVPQGTSFSIQMEKNSEGMQVFTLTQIPSAE